MSIHVKKIHEYNILMNYLKNNGYYCDNKTPPTSKNYFSGNNFFYIFKW